MRLKVFRAQFGFYDSVVAASSQAAALRAWGTHQNLFASGQAKISEDSEANETAVRHPEIPLRRPIGSNQAFELDPTGAPVIPTEKRASPARVARPRDKLSKPDKPAADRTGLTAAEEAVKKVDGDRKREEAAFRRREDKLEADRNAAQSAFVARRKEADAALAEAQKVYRKAGGTD